MEDSLAARLAGVARRSTARLTHHGRRSGKPYDVTVWFMVEGETVYLATMDMRRQWPRNLLVRPDLELTINGERFSGSAELISDDSGIGRVVELLKGKYWPARLYLWFKGRPDGAFRVGLNG